MRKIIAAMLQPVCEPGNVKANLMQAERLCVQATLAGAHIICLPELFNTGYHLQQLGYDTLKLGAQYFQLTLDLFSELAEKLKCHIICPILEPIDNKMLAYNTAFIFDEQGQCIGNYRKVHLWRTEKQFFKAGEKLQVFNTNLGRIAILLCYDVGFPEAARSLCLQNAEILFVPAAWRYEDKHIWDLNLAQRALENTFFTIGVNTSMQVTETHLFGNSKAYNPHGRCIQAMQTENDFKLVIIDLDDITRARTEYDYLKDLKPHIY